jgi:hypothetical protein
MTNAFLVSGVVRNYVLAHDLGAGIAGIVFVHVVLVPRLTEGCEFLKAANSVLGPVLVGMAFGTTELLPCCMFFFAVVAFGLDRMLLQMTLNGRWKYPRF